MGIKDFFKFLKTRHPECFHPTRYADFAYQRLAVDMMNLLYIFRARSEREWMSHVVAFLLSLRRERVHPVCVFDGASHPLKADTVQKRRDERARGRTRVQTLRTALGVYLEEGAIDATLRECLQKHPEFASALTGRIQVHALDEYLTRQEQQYALHFEAQEVDALKSVLRAAGLCTLTAAHDGEALCSHLAARGYVSAVLSNDSDVFFFGCPRLVCKFTDEGGYRVDRDELLTKMNLTPEQFVDLCLLCGTDFYPTVVRGIGFVKAYGLVQAHASIDDPSFPLYDQLDHARLGEIRQMAAIPDDLPVVSYATPEVSPSFHALSFQYQLQIDTPLTSFPVTVPVLLDDDS
jgi:5'-3' exonuclease